MPSNCCRRTPPARSRTVRRQRRSVASDDGRPSRASARTATCELLSFILCEGVLTRILLSKHPGIQLEYSIKLIPSASVNHSYDDIAPA